MILILDYLVSSSRMMRIMIRENIFLIIKPVEPERSGQFWLCLCRLIHIRIKLVASYLLICNIAKLTNILFLNSTHNYFLFSLVLSLTLDILAEAYQFSVMRSIVNVRAPRHALLLTVDRFN